MTFRDNCIVSEAKGGSNRGFDGCKFDLLMTRKQAGKRIFTVVESRLATPYLQTKYVHLNSNATANINIAFENNISKI